MAVKIVLGGIQEANNVDLTYKKAKDNKLFGLGSDVERSPMSHCGCY